MDCCGLRCCLFLQLGDADAGVEGAGIISTSTPSSSRWPVLVSRRVLDMVTSESSAPMSSGMLRWISGLDDAGDHLVARLATKSATRRSFPRASIALTRAPRHSAWIRHAASARMARFHSRYCMYVLASGALSAAPFGARPCIWTNASSNWVICARRARHAATVRLRSVDVDVSARYCSLVADMWFVDTPLLALDTDACPTEDWGERGASMARRPGDQF